MTEIKELKDGTELTNQFLEFVKNCSWEECKDHIADMIQIGILQIGKECLWQFVMGK